MPTNASRLVKILKNAYGFMPGDDYKYLTYPWMLFLCLAMAMISLGFPGWDCCI